MRKVIFLDVDGVLNSELNEKIKKVAILATFLVRMKGLEPTRHCCH